MSELTTESTPVSFDAATRPFYWSVRRELWENRSIYLAPLIVAAVVLFASLMSNIGLPQRIQNAERMEPAKRHAAIVKPFSMAPAPIMLASFLVGLFYSLDALHGERRDRSILFWKSLPVSDRMTVLSKASIPMVVLPLIAFALSVATVFVMFIVSTGILLITGHSPVPLWRELRLVQEPIIMLYGLTVHALWFAPVYGWLLMISAWARRAVLLWAVVPWLALSTFEAIVAGQSYFAQMIAYRVTGAMTEAFASRGQPPGGEMLDGLSQLSPLRFLGSAGLWTGLVFAALFLMAAVRLRRNREPI